MFRKSRERPNRKSLEVAGRNLTDCRTSRDHFVSVVRYSFTPFSSLSAWRRFRMVELPMFALRELELGGPRLGKENFRCLWPCLGKRGTNAMSNFPPDRRLHLISCGSKAN